MLFGLGVIAEMEEINPQAAVEGWPVGIVEALLALKRRGILLAIISKNSEARVRDLFGPMFMQRFTLDDFAIVKINWKSKIENIGEAMREANLLPQSVVFLDDNPVERAAVKAAFPEIRVIEAPHQYWKRILLWSPETQVAAISEESSRRSEMIKAQVERESFRGAVSRDEFLSGLGVKVRVFQIAQEGGAFDRALELLNKTNQFNTTGTRWARHDLDEVRKEGGLFAAEVQDRFTNYGLVFAAIARDDTIEQVVMSCRVISLGVEEAAMSVLTERLLQVYGSVAGRLIETKANLPARDLFEKCGWTLEDDVWCATLTLPPPSHVEIQDEIPPERAGRAA